MGSLEDGSDKRRCVKGCTYHCRLRVAGLAFKIRGAEHRGSSELRAMGKEMSFDGSR